MANLLLCSPPLRGHVGPAVAVGRALTEAGHRVVMLTGRAFADEVVSAGLEFETLDHTADFDERDPSTFTPDQHRYRGLALSRYQVDQTFVRPIPGQFRSLAALMAREGFDAVFADGTFAGALPLLARPRSERPPVFGLGTMPLAQTSVDVPPYNSGLRVRSGPAMRLRNRAANLAVRRVMFRSTQRLARALVEAEGGELSGFILDLSASFDKFLQLGPAEFEYRRSDLRPNTIFAGPIVAHHERRAGWAQVDDVVPVDDVVHGGQPVIHVTQGTLDNHDFSQLVMPTVEGLATADVRVVVSTAGAPLSRLGPLPRNAVAVEFVGHEALLPRTSVFVTNGGFGGVMAALRHGVPVVVAPGGEDKPEVAARVEHFGVGVDLRTRRPTPEQVSAGVHTALTRPDIEAAATGMAEVMRNYRPVATILSALSEALT